ncbi:VOC family protein [Lacibacter sp. H375]|uniref:VOC family protein n=1 Tax=Lacibacter sp. H375 TaxID=3133424 RepID=UPI0040402767
MQQHLVNSSYIVNDVEASIIFYTTCLGFKLSITAAPAFAVVTSENMRLLLNAKTSSAGRSWFP